jgi:hypothetical protein
VIPVVIDASAGVEIAANTMRGRALDALLPADAVLWVPELFYVECASVLRRWELVGLMKPAQIARASGSSLPGPSGWRGCGACSRTRGGTAPTSPSRTRCT